MRGIQIKLTRHQSGWFERLRRQMERSCFL